MPPTPPRPGFSSQAKADENSDEDEGGDGFYEKSAGLAIMMASSTPSSSAWSAPSSSLTAMRSAWKVRVAGWVLAPLRPPRAREVLLAWALAGLPVVLILLQPDLGSALVLGSARMRAQEQGTAPMLLLDEIAAHLDSRRLGALFDEILGLGAQVWMTGTDSGLFEPLAGRAQFFSVAEATVTAVL